MKISNSEIEGFLRCRRMWDYSSSNRQGLRSLSPSSNLAFHVGTIVHQVLEAQVTLGRKPDIMGIIDRAEEELEDSYRKIVGTGWSSAERAQLQDSRELAYGMMTHYFNHWGEVNPLGTDLRYLHAELTFEVPIPGTEHSFIGTIDGVAEDGQGDIYLVEHKTTSMGFPNEADLQTGRQLQSYVWAARYVINRPVRGIIYDGIAKRVPRIPEVTRRGELSRAPIVTTPEIYREAIRVCGLDEADYAEILAKLSGPSQFFRRYTISYPERSLALFSQQLEQIVTDMANEELPVYPNRVWQGCWDCRYQELCTAQQLGEDTSFIRELKFKQDPDTAPSRRSTAVTHLEL